MTISKRLLTIISMIPQCERIIDVGCDHALLDIYVIANKIVDTSLAIDINDGALKQAIINVKKAHLDKQISLYLNDGLNGIKIQPTDVIIIAGLGCRNIIKILKPYIAKIDKIIIQSNNEHYELRKWLHNRGYIITKEEFICEHHKKYIVMAFQKGKQSYHYLDYWLGPYLKNNKEYLDYVYNYYLNLEKMIPKQNFIRKLVVKKKTLFLKKKSRSV